MLLLGYFEFACFVEPFLPVQALVAVGTVRLLLVGVVSPLPPCLDVISLVGEAVKCNKKTK